MHYGFVPTLMQRQPKNWSFISDLYKNQKPYKKNFFFSNYEKINKIEKYFASTILGIS